MEVREDIVSLDFILQAIKISEVLYRCDMGVTLWRSGWGVQRTDLGWQQEKGGVITWVRGDNVTATV